MTRAVSAIALVLGVACVVFALLWARAKEDADGLRLLGVKELEQHQAALARAKAGLATAEKRAADERTRARKAEQRALKTQSRARTRIRVVRVFEETLVAAEPSWLGARASLARETEAREQVHRLRLSIIGRLRTPNTQKIDTRTSTLGLAWEAMARWEANAWEAIELAKASTTALAAAQVSIRSARAETEVERAKRGEVLARSALDLKRAEVKLAKRVTSAKRTRNVVEGAACAAGVATAVLGASLCTKETCRQALGLGGASVGTLGCGALILDW